MVGESWHGLLYCLQLVVILIGTVLCQETLCPLTTANCSQFDITCTVNSLTNCSDLSKSELGGSTNSYPGPVTSFEVGTEILTRNMEIMWKLPKYGSYSYLTGFGVIITSASDLYRECFVYNISSSKWSGDLSKYKFVHHCTSLKEGQYTVDVITLPKSSESDVKETAIVRILRWDSDCNMTEASCWKTNIVVYSRPCDNLVNVTFNMAPDETEITHYLVTLIYENSFFPDTSVNVTHVSGEKAGYAILNISQLDLPLSDRLIMVKPGGKICDLNNCLISITKPFTIIKPTEKDCVFDYDMPLEPNLSKTWLAFIITGSIMLPFIVVAIVLMIIKCRYGPIPRKSLYLVYSKDNHRHQRVMEHFVDYLSSVFSCDVINSIRDADLDKERSNCANKMSACDNIIVVTSQGSYHRSFAIQNDGDFDDVFSTAYDLIRQDTYRTDSELTGKLIFVHFEYTPRQFASLFLPCLNTTRNYLLMGEAKSLYRRIHRLSGRQRISTSLSCDQEMLNSIRDAIQYSDLHAHHAYVNPFIIEESIDSSALGDLVDEINRD